MKTTILILALFCFSFSIESSTHCEELALEQSTEVITVTIHHNLGNGEFIELEVPAEGVIGHMFHGDHIACVPPDCGDI